MVEGGVRISRTGTRPPHDGPEAGSMLNIIFLVQPVERSICPWPYRCFDGSLDVPGFPSVFFQFLGSTQQLT